MLCICTLLDVRTCPFRMVPSHVLRRQVIETDGIASSLRAYQVQPHASSPHDCKVRPSEPGNQGSRKQEAGSRRRCSGINPTGGEFLRLRQIRPVWQAVSSHLIFMLHILFSIYNSSTSREDEWRHRSQWAVSDGTGSVIAHYWPFVVSKMIRRMKSPTLQTSDSPERGNLPLSGPS